MANEITKVLVVGGGTSGWITAGLIAAEYNAKADNSMEVILIESPDVPPIGVGEGTWPTMRNTLNKLGISETDFFRRCDASFKQASKFINWVHEPSIKKSDSYYHPFSLPAKFVEANLANQWQFVKENISFANALNSQVYICDRGLAPKQITTPEYAAVVNYGYHLDSFKFSELLKQHAQTHLGVKFISDDVIGIISADDGDIESVISRRNGNIEADLFIDCTGFSSLLIGKHYQVPFQSVNQYLFADTALAVQIPYESFDTPIASATLSTGKKAGWIWDIGLPTRRGVGYVFSSAHTNTDRAESELASYVHAAGVDIGQHIVRKIDIRAGYRTKPWHRNCVAVGLAGGFLEPLEASSLVMVELAAKAIAEELPATRSTMDLVAKKYNHIFNYRWERIVDFLKLHYVLTKRKDSDFWIDNSRIDTIPDSLQESLELWKYRGPWHSDFLHRDEVFSAASYQYVLYGMGFETSIPKYHCAIKNSYELDKVIAQTMSSAQKMVQALPTNRELIEKIRSFGMQKI